MMPPRRAVTLVRKISTGRVSPYPPTVITRTSPATWLSTGPAFGTPRTSTRRREATTSGWDPRPATLHRMGQAVSRHDGIIPPSPGGPPG